MVYKGESEYGGVDGIIQPAEKGHVLLDAGEKRMVGTIISHRTAGVDPNLPEGDLHKEYADSVYAELPIRTAGRTEQDLA